MPSSYLYRLQLHPGEPVSLVRHRKPTFLDLPREIRDEIYHHSLCCAGPEPITLYQSSQDLCTKTDAPSPLAGLATSLFYANRTVSREALETFYSSNTFVISEPQKNWARLWTFLWTIGAVNRSHLRSLAIRAPYSEVAYELPDGTLYQYAYDPNEPKKGSYCQILSPDVRLPPRLDGAGTAATTATPEPGHPTSTAAAAREREVEVFEPATRAVFRILGAGAAAAGRGDGVVVEHKVKLVLWPEFCNSPGCNAICQYWTDTLTTCAPETLQRFVEEEAGGRVDLVWATLCDKQAFLDRRAHLEEARWRVLGLDEKPWPSRDWSSAGLIRVTLRWLGGPGAVGGGG